MQLTCKVNQAEAIRRGHNASSTIKLEINPADLTQEERETLAQHFKDGEFVHKMRSSGLWLGGEINEPTVNGLREALANIEAKITEAAALCDLATAECVAHARTRFALRETKETESTLYAYLKNGQTVITDSYGQTPDVFGKAQTRTVAPLIHQNYGEFEKEWKRLMATPEGQAWQSELDAINAKSRVKEEAAAIADLIPKAEAAAAQAAAKAARDAYYAEVIRTQGTPLQIERMNRGVMSVKQEARAILADSLIQNPDNLPTAPENTEDRAYQPKSPITDEDMASILRYETANPGATAELQTCTYTDPDDGEQSTTTELWLTLPHKHGITLQRDFLVA